MKRTRVMGGHSARVGSLSWNSHILSSGSRSGHIHHHDVRQGEHLVAELSSHTQEVRKCCSSQCALFSFVAVRRTSYANVIFFVIH
jgi:WD40 repeat protein